MEYLLGNLTRRSVAASQKMAEEASIFFLRYRMINLIPMLPPMGREGFPLQALIKWRAKVY